MGFDVILIIHVVIFWDGNITVFFALFLILLVSLALEPATQAKCRCNFDESILGNINY